jgi:hypothetical protein
MTTTQPLIFKKEEVFELFDRRGGEKEDPG